ncbi:MAG TPA: hypothetical protein VFG86_02005, partial [Chloroflexota bacterium]|nr:hypothetical protein [Chloroflexota bacterium]
MAAQLPRGYRSWARQRRSQYWAKRRQVRADLLNPQQPLSGESLMNVAKASVGVSLDPQLSALDTQARSARIQQGAAVARTGGYYKDLAESAASDIARSQALSSTLRGRLADIGSEGQAAIDRAQQAADVAQARDVGVRGPGLSGGGDERVRAELAAARAQAAQTSEAGRVTGENIGASWEGLLRASAAAQTMRGGEVRNQMMNRLSNELADIRTKKQTLQAQRGPMVLDQLGKLRQQAFENAATASALGQKQLAQQFEQQYKQAELALQGKKVEEAGRTNRARIRATLRGQDITARGQDVSAGTQRRGQDIGWKKTKYTQAQENRRARMRAKKKGVQRMSAPVQKALQDIGVIRSAYEGKRTPAQQKKT